MTATEDAKANDVAKDSFNTIALFGANGQIGSHILRALLKTQLQKFDILAFIQPGTTSPEKHDTSSKLRITEVDLTTISQSDLVLHLKGVDAIISALNGSALKSQSLILEAAVQAGVKRIYPSEYGMHHIYTSQDGSGWVHLMWNMKSNANESILKHSAVFAGKISYTLIGCGDYYNQDREVIWCPWTQDPDKLPGGKYTLHVVGDENEKADFTHLDDFAEFLVRTLQEPEKSRNKKLNVVSDSVSYAEIAKLLKKYSGKEVEFEKYGFERQRDILNDLDQAPKELAEAEKSGKSFFPVDFWFLVKGLQGAGRFRWPIGERHEREFGMEKMRTFEWYFKDRFGGKGR